MSLRIEQGMVVRPIKDHSGPMAHPYIVLSIPKVPYKAQEFVQCVSVTSMKDKEITTEIPIVICGKKSYVAPYAIHSFSYNELPPENIEGIAMPSFMSFNDFKELIAILYHHYLMGTESSEEAITLRSDYIDKFNQAYPDLEEFRDSPEKNHNVTMIVPRKISGTKSDYTVNKNNQITNNGTNVQFIKKAKSSFQNKEQIESPKVEPPVCSTLISPSLSVDDKMRKLTELFKKRGITESQVANWDANMVHTFIEIYDDMGAQALSKKLGINVSKLYTLSYNARNRGIQMGMRFESKVGRKRANS